MVRLTKTACNYLHISQPNRPIKATHNPCNLVMLQFVIRIFSIALKTISVHICYMPTTEKENITDMYAGSINQNCMFTMKPLAA